MPKYHRIKGVQHDANARCEGMPTRRLRGRGAGLPGATMLVAGALVAATAWAITEWAIDEAANRVHR